MQTRGFTLIELIVVIVIIAILAAFIFPAMKGAMESGRQKACMANMVQIAQALKQYYQDHRAYPPSPVDGSGNYVPTAGLAMLMEDSLPMICKNDARDGSTFEGGVRFSYAYDDPDRLMAGVVPAATVDRLLYNYWGYDSEGYETVATDLYGQANPTAVSPPGVAAPPPLPITRWGEFPFLINRSAPPHTIVTHCPFHRLDGVELILRLDGSVQTKPDFVINEDTDVTRWEQEAIDNSVPGDWVTQPMD